MNKIVLNNGQEIEGATIVKAIWTDDQILVSLPNQNLVQIAVLFGDAENIKQIDYYYGMLKDSYYGYTIVTDIRVNSSINGVDVMLKGTESAHIDRGYTIPHNFIPEVIANSILTDKEKKENGSENDSNGSTRGDQ